jgi:hypothetical protein
MREILPIIEHHLEKYQSEHLGEMPLYIILAEEEAEHFLQEVKMEEGYDDHTIITAYKGSKVVKNIALKPGEIRLSNELPETGS